MALGEKFTADGKTRQIGIIRAAQNEKDMAQGMKKGDWICIAAETLEDIPVDKSRIVLGLRSLSASRISAGNAPLPPG